jgi:hypothetical protein
VCQRETERERVGKIPMVLINYDIKIYTIYFRTGDVAKVAQHSPRKCKALSLNSNTSIKKTFKIYALILEVIVFLNTRVKFWNYLA